MQIPHKKAPNNPVFSRTHTLQLEKNILFFCSIPKIKESKQNKAILLTENSFRFLYLFFNQWKCSLSFLGMKRKNQRKTGENAAPPFFKEFQCNARSFMRIVVLVSYKKKTNVARSPSYVLIFIHFIQSLFRPKERRGRVWIRLPLSCCWYRSALEVLFVKFDKILSVP